MKYHCDECGKTFCDDEVIWKKTSEFSEAWGVGKVTHTEYATCFCGSDQVGEVEEKDPDEPDDSPPASVLKSTGDAQAAGRSATGRESALNRVLIEIARSGAMREW